MSGLSGVSRPLLTPAEAAAVRGLAGGAGYSGSLPVMLVGDSNIAQSWDTGPTLTALVDNGNDTATATFSGNHNWAVGGRISLSNSPDRKFNVFSALVTAVSTGPATATFQLGGRTSPVVSGAVGSTVAQHMGRYSTIGLCGWLEALQGRQLRYLVAAAGGADSAQALSLYLDALPSAQAANVSDIVVLAGTNDVFARAWDFETAQSSLKALIDGIRTTSPARIWWLIPPPFGSASAAWSSTKQTVMNRLIRWIWRYSSQVGVTPIDTWRGVQNGLTFVNPGASNPDASAGFLAADNTHTTNLGALAVARSIDAQWRRLQPALGLGYQGAHSATQGQGNALTNSHLAGTAGTKTPGGGTIAGNAPDSWTVEITSGTGTLTLTSPGRTVVADGDAAGNNLQAVISGGATSWRLVNTASIHTAVTAGQIRGGYVPVKITGAAGLTGIELVLFGAKSSGGNENLGFVGVSQAISGDLDVCMRLPQWTVPTGLTSLLFFVRFTGATAGTFVVGKPCFELVE